MKTKELFNYTDSECAWGYITLCDDCAAKNKDRHVDTSKKVSGFLCAEYCEYCEWHHPKT